MYSNDVTDCWSLMRPSCKYLTSSVMIQSCAPASGWCQSLIKSLSHILWVTRAAWIKTCDIMYYWGFCLLSNHACKPQYRAFSCMINISTHWACRVVVSRHLSKKIFLFYWTLGNSGFWFWFGFVVASSAACAFVLLLAGFAFIFKCRRVDYEILAWF